MNNFTYFFWYRWNYIWKYRLRIIKAAFKWQPYSYIYTVDLLAESLRQQANHFTDLSDSDVSLLRDAKHINKIVSLLEYVYQDKFIDKYLERYPMPDMNSEDFMQWLDRKEPAEKTEYFIECLTKQEKAEKLVWRLISSHIKSWVN